MRRVVVCVRQGLDGELGAFDAAAYEAALRLPDTEVILLSLGPASVEPFLLRLTRLGAHRAVLLCDPLFAGSDTLATAYLLACALSELAPDLVFCGRQTLVGDTAQVGPMLATLSGYSLFANVMALEQTPDGLRCTLRGGEEHAVPQPALLTFERIYRLRLPGLRSKPGAVERRDAAALRVDPSRCGLAGSPTRVVRTVENQSGRRRCTFLSLNELAGTIEQARRRQAKPADLPKSDRRLGRVCIVGEAPRAFAESVSDDVRLLAPADPQTLAAEIRAADPAAVLWGSDDRSKALAAQTAALLRVGLCADCTALFIDGNELLLTRPALSGSVLATIRCLTRPAMGTVRTEGGDARELLLAVGFGARAQIEELKALASKLDAGLAASRRAVDEGLLPYACQVGLTGRTVAPPVYLAVGVSGAVHHIVGMQRAGVVIAVNPDRGAPIFDYADYGIIATAEELLAAL